MPCTHDASRYLHLAPVPCNVCRGWVDKDGSVMTADEAIRRYPEQEVQIRRAIPFVAPPERSGLVEGAAAVADLVGTFFRLVQALALIAIALIVAYLVLHTIL